MKGVKLGLEFSIQTYSLMTLPHSPMMIKQWCRVSIKTALTNQGKLTRLLIGLKCVIGGLHCEVRENRRDCRSKNVGQQLSYSAVTNGEMSKDVGFTFA